MSAFDLLAEGKIFESIFQPFIEILGPNGISILYIILYMSALGFIYLKTKNVTLISVTIMLTSVILIPFVPSFMQKYFFMMLLAGIVLGIYKVIWGR